MLDWQKQVVRATMEGAGEHKGVQLQFLLQRLEACPQALPAIVASIRDMGHWLERHADELEREGIRRAGGAAIIPIDRK